MDTITRTFTVAVTAVNDAPTLTAIPDPAAILEDAMEQTVNLAGISAGGGETQTLIVTASSNNTGLIPNPTVTYTSPDAAGSLAYTPVPNASGSAIITVTVDDGQAANNTVTRTFTVNVTSVNDQPTLAAIPNPATIPVSAPMQTVSLAGISAGGGESQTLVVTASSDNTGLIPNPTVTYTSPNATGSLAYTPVAGQSGSAVITVTVDDGQVSNNTVARTFTVNVNTPNMAPTITGQNVVSTPQETARAIVLGDLLVSDPDNTYPTGFTLTVMDGTNYTRAGNTVTPDPGFTGNLSVPVKVNDGTDDSNIFNLVVSVTPAVVDPVTTIAYKTGDAVPGEPMGTVFKTFGAPQLDGSSLAFLATIDPLVGSTVKAIVGGAVPGVLYRVGTTAPGMDGGTFSTFKDPVSANGKLAFIGAAKVGTGTPAVARTNDAGIWADNFGPLAILAREGGLAPGAGGGVFASFTAIANHPDAVIFVAKLESGVGGVTPATDTGVWRATSGGVSLLVREGDPITVDGGVPRMVKSIKALSSVSGSPDQNRWLDSAGTFHYFVAFADHSLAAIAAPLVGPATADLLTGDTTTAPAGALFKTFSVPAANDQGAALLGTLTVGAGGVLSLNDTGIFIGNGGSGFGAAFREGDTAPGADSAAFYKFKDPALSGTSIATFLAYLKQGTGMPAADKTNDTGLWSNAGGSLALLARESGTAPGIAGATFASVYGFEVNPDSAPVRANAFTAKLTLGVAAVDKTNSFGLWAADKNGTTHLLARSGSPVTTAPGSPTIKTFIALRAASGSPGAGRATNGTGGITFRASLGTAGQAIVVVQMP